MYIAIVPPKSKDLRINFKNRSVSCELIVILVSV